MSPHARAAQLNGTCDDDIKHRGLTQEALAAKADDRQRERVHDDGAQRHLSGGHVRDIAPESEQPRDRLETAGHHPSGRRLASHPEASLRAARVDSPTIGVAS